MGCSGTQPQRLEVGLEVPFPQRKVQLAHNPPGLAREIFEEKVRNIITLLSLCVEGK